MLGERMLEQALASLKVPSESITWERWDALGMEPKTIEIPDELRGLPPSRSVEVGRLVADGRSAGSRLAATLGLIEATIIYGRNHGLVYGFSFIKGRLLRGLEQLALPFHRIRGAELVYPRDGLLAGYFYAATEMVIPVYYFRDQLGAALSRRRRQATP